MQQLPTPKLPNKNSKTFQNIKKIKAKTKILISLFYKLFEPSIKITSPKTQSHVLLFYLSIFSTKNKFPTNFTKKSSKFRIKFKHKVQKKNTKGQQQHV
jgi:hypothetical protein